MESDCPDCFGIDSKCGKLESCHSCEFQESCKLCAEDDGSRCNRRLGHVSYDRYSYSKEIAATPSPDPEPCEPLEHADTRRVMEFLLDIDNYTAELVSEVLHGNVSTASDIARKMGVSRQAIHRKIVDCCHLHPELRKLFITRLYRCRRILTDSKRLSSKGNPNQMEFDF